MAIQDTQARIDEARTKRKKFEAEAEFYKKKPMPADLTKELRTLEHEIKIQQELLEVKKREFDTIKAKYDADRKRYYGHQASADGRPEQRGSCASSTAALINQSVFSAANH